VAIWYGHLTRRILLVSKKIEISAKKNFSQKKFFLKNFFHKNFSVFRSLIQFLFSKSMKAVVTID
jgi:hypothetical protein